MRLDSIQNRLHTQCDKIDIMTLQMDKITFNNYVIKICS